ncbi:hypothetical protein RND71_005404 [Anisodus tanguticus]|uniref:Uncharacterized protein n=1 Tax=Anisodus tanguticus TaxID=243964 RepID=A0AAE1SRG2_9SOLA|nr:hypothetical protein RND71_005404 [Anisodus tanguticus]
MEDHFQRSMEDKKSLDKVHKTFSRDRYAILLCLTLGNLEKYPNRVNPNQIFKLESNSSHIFQITNIQDFDRITRLGLGNNHGRICRTVILFDLLREKYISIAKLELSKNSQNSPHDQKHILSLVYLQEPQLISSYWIILLGSCSTRPYSPLSDVPKAKISLVEAVKDFHADAAVEEMAGDNPPTEANPTNDLEVPVVWELDHKAGSERLAQLENEWTVWKNRLAQATPTLPARSFEVASEGTYSSVMATLLSVYPVAQLSVDILMDLQSEGITASVTQDVLPTAEQQPEDILAADTQVFSEIPSVVVAEPLLDAERAAKHNVKGTSEKMFKRRKKRVDQSETDTWKNQQIQVAEESSVSAWGTITSSSRVRLGNWIDVTLTEHRVFWIESAVEPLPQDHFTRSCLLS